MLSVSLVNFDNCNGPLPSQIKNIFYHKGFSLSALQAVSTLTSLYPRKHFLDIYQDLGKIVIFSL